jgi:prolyl oligopeptidase
MRKLNAFLVLLAAAACAQTADKYAWLEDVNGARAMAWVKAENAKTAAVLEKDPHFAPLEAAALKVLESPERLPTPQLNGNDVYNLWKDATHQRGILRRTSIADYQEPQPHWQTILDYDALAKQDNEKWVSHGLNCLYPEDDRCLVLLSAGGEDADTEREFSLKTGKFIPAGFVLSHSKQNVDWVDENTLLVSRDWGAGTMTKSGYPFVVKVWKRGQPLAQAKEVFRGAETDQLPTGGATIHDSEGHHVTLISRGVTFFETKQFLWTPEGVKPIALPAKSRLIGLLSGRLVVSLDEDWQSVPQGSVIALDLEALKKDPQHLKPHVVFSPSATEFVQDGRATKNHLLLSTLENVQGRVYSYTPGPDGSWSNTRLHVPDNGAVDIVTANWSDDRFVISFTGFVTPTSLLLGDAANGNLKVVKTLPAQFDASGESVEQLSAISKDGTKVPYFVVGPKNMKYDGSNPTVLTAYGGFQVSETPQYSASVGKLWLEHGGVFVLANIRGGGEFGPAWHEAGLKTHRQRIYDDFAAVGRDLVTRKITTPRRLGIQGGSNGGLLMGVEMTQHPEMWNAVVIQVPLLDMLGFEHIAAGASWVGEYGSVSVPEERTFLASISPYEQLRKDAKYPEPLIFTTTKDDRVGPVHARKFAAKMEEFGHPFFYDEIIEGGHSAGADLKERARTFAEQFTYLTRKLMD